MTMEIPKSLQEEIQSVQNKLKNAIQNHQVYVGKLNDDPNNEELLGQLHEIQEHIISLSKCQKQVVQRLRKEVKLYEAANSNGTKVSIASLLGLNNNNNITNNNETKTTDSEKTVNGKNFNGLSRRSSRSSKDDYEDEIQNVDLPSPSDDCQNNCAKEKPRGDETDSNDEDVIEIGVANDSISKRNSKIQLSYKLDFLGSLGLITSDKHTELQNKRAERKRRSTANPQFVYSNWEIPTKRKRHSYLQSNGTAPQTRQTTARLNGPSPPPNKVATIKPTPPPPRAPIKSLIPTQKSSTRPNILRNNPDSKIFTGKVKSENGLCQTQSSLNSKSVQSVGNKAVHIPGLPSSLTIERVENDSSAVCINCRNPGNLATCELCTATYHVSCHLVTSVPPRTCPKCLSKTRERESSNTLADQCKEEDEIATTSNTPGFIGKTGEDSEVYKTACGFHKVDATEKRSVPAIGFNQLPSSTFLIPIAPNSVPSSSTVTTSLSTIGVSQSDSVVSTTATINRESKISTPYSSILLNQLSQSTNINSGDNNQVSYAYQLPVSGVQQEKSQSYLILKKITNSQAIAARKKSLFSSSVPGNESEKRYSPSSVIDHQQQSSNTFISYNDNNQSEIKTIPDYSQSSSNCSRQFTGKFKYNGQGIVGAEDTTTKQICASQSESENKCFNGDNKRIGRIHSKLSINQLRPSTQSNTFIPLHSIIDDVESISQSDAQEQSENSGETWAAAGGKGKSKSNLLYSLFPSNNQPHSFSGRFVNSENSTAEQIEPEFEPSQGGESNCDTYDRTGSRLKYSSSTNNTEHVKLEEAHLPAPLRPNLVRRSIDDIIATLDKKMLSNSSSKEGKSDDFQDCGDRGDGVKSNSDDVNSDFNSFEDYHNENLKATLNFIAVERNHSSGTYIKFHDFEERGNLRETNSKNVRRREQKVSNLSCGVGELLRKRFSAIIKKQLSPSEIKADFERQDLPINECELIEYEDVTTNDNININNLSNEGKTKLGINAVSNENMQVLEQFESAMLEAAEDETANC